MGSDTGAPPAGGQAGRESVARDLHDSVARTLVTMLLELEAFKVDQAGRQSVLREVAIFEDFVRDALGSLRDILKGLHDERDLVDGIVPALRQRLIPTFERFYRIPVSLSVKGDAADRMTAAAELAAYRIIQEAVINAGRHSGARAIRITLQSSRRALVGEIADDGRGFSVADVDGIGTRNMQDRAVSVGGELSIDSALGSGTTVRLRIPAGRRRRQRFSAAC